MRFPFAGEASQTRDTSTSFSGVMSSTRLSRGEEEEAGEKESSSETGEQEVTFRGEGEEGAVDPAPTKPAKKGEKSKVKQTPATETVPPSDTNTEEEERGRKAKKGAPAFEVRN